jgi:hypothetical protein
VKVSWSLSKPIQTPTNSLALGGVALFVAVTLFDCVLSTTPKMNTTNQNVSRTHFISFEQSV